jgi:hypothetical protein
VDDVLVQRPVDGDRWGAMTSHSRRPAANRRTRFTLPPEVSTTFTDGVLRVEFLLDLSQCGEQAAGMAHVELPGQVCLPSHVALR